MIVSERPGPWRLVDGVSGPGVGAEDEDVAAGEHVAPGREGLLGLRRDSLLGARADQEQRQRQGQPGRHRDCEPLEDAPGRDAAVLAARRARPRRRRGCARGAASGRPGRRREPGASCARGKPCTPGGPEGRESDWSPPSVYLPAMPPRRVIGIDAGGTKLLGGVVDEALVVHHRVHRTWRGADRQETLDIFTGAVEEVRAAAPDVE